jgi:hypothetical protein
MEVFRLGDRLHEKRFLPSSGVPLPTKHTEVGGIIHLIVSYRDASAGVKIGLPWAAPIIEPMNSPFVDSYGGG